jgi:hypothetical protein
VVLDFNCFTPQNVRAVIPLIKGKVRQFIFISKVDIYGYPLARCLAKVAISCDLPPETWSKL